MRFGLFHSVQWPEGTDQRERYREALAQAARAEEIGLQSVWLTEHHFSRHGITADSVTILSHLAAMTERIRLGTAVAVLPFHHPLRLAESVATLDQLSDGRVDFGIGRGFQWWEFHRFGVDLAEATERFEEAIGLIQRAWRTSEPFRHEGKYWQFDDVEVQPKPLQRPHPPVWVASGSEAGIRRCVENDWNLMLTQGLPPEIIAGQIATYRRLLAEAGKPFDPARLLVARALYVGRDDATAWAQVDEPYGRFLQRARRLAAPPDGSPGVSPSAPDGATNPFDTETLRAASVFGGPATCVERISALRALGVEHILFFIHIGDLSHGQIMTSLDRLHDEVLPQVQAL